MTAEQDIVLIYFEDNPLVFARIENIAPDTKKNWFQVTMLLLQLPLQTVTWILREAYINGEPFTMNGKAIRLERVVCPEAPDQQGPAQEHSSNEIARKDNIISLADLKKK